MGKNLGDSDDEEEEEDENGMPKHEKEKQKNKIVKQTRNTTIMTKFRNHARVNSEIPVAKKLDHEWLIKSS